MRTIGRWECYACGAVFAAKDLPEDVMKDVPAAHASACGVCDTKAGFINLDYQPHSSIILPPGYSA